MAKGKKTGGRDFVKGQTNGPGRRKLPDGDIRKRRMTRDDAVTMLAHYCQSTYSQLKEYIKNKDNMPVVDLLIIRMLESAIAKADLQKLDWVFNRLFPDYKKLPQKDRTIVLSYNIDGNKNNDTEVKINNKEIENVPYKEIK